jgi:protein EFR3
LVTLAIFKALVTECRRELSLLSAPLIASVANTLSLLETDVEVTARVASLVCHLVFSLENESALLLNDTHA